MAVSLISTIAFVVTFLSILLYLVFVQKFISYLQNKYPKVAKERKLDKGNLVTISMWHPIRQLYLKLTTLGIMFKSSLMLDSKLKSYIWLMRLCMIIALIGIVTIILTV